ncbi:hypothetical protein RFI_05774 [Reticulomyxa filosa]|uniref:Uncharacterized protein n=1 Tax=Reticulomyxa filosa TaxID=46433 RepID=X6NZS8_RETFI|nr:hypothetical protein RFI_05774 [Reticulomyxa filosa]|eukprot:ETO31344.1 hypothetical protein RFI_05774 [Reticulomyxa filosa]
MYPLKKNKNKMRDQMVAALLIECDNAKDKEYLMIKRDKKGLLAGQWEFPTMVISDGVDEVKCSSSKLQRKECEKKLREYWIGFDDGFNSHYVYIGESVHLFSHIRQQTLIFLITVDQTCKKNVTQLLTQKNMEFDWVSQSLLETSKKLTVCVHKVWLCKINQNTAQSNCLKQTVIEQSFQTKKKNPKNERENEMKSNCFFSRI